MIIIFILFLAAIIYFIFSYNPWFLKNLRAAVERIGKEDSGIIKEKEVDQIKTEFISVVSHELRTPLAITKESLSLVLDGTIGSLNEEQIKILTTAKKNINRLANIINELLDISRIEAGKMELKRDSVDLNSLINGLISSFSDHAKIKGIELKVSFSQKQIVLYADAEKLKQIFINLLANALKFTENGWIEVIILEKENEVECSVIDTGIGISEDNLPKVFDKFQQFNRVPGAGEKGTGLGLSIVKALVELHFGKIWVESRSGQGAKFSFTLPKYTPEIFFREYLNIAIKEETKKNGRFSLILVTITFLKFPAIAEQEKQVLSNEEAQLFFKDIEGALKSTLRRAGDLVIKDTGEIMVLLSDCAKTGAQAVKIRLQEAVDDILAKKWTGKKNSLRFSLAVYPDDAQSAEELINYARTSKGPGLQIPN